MRVRFGSSDGAGAPIASAPVGALVADFSQVRQHMSGFGVSDRNAGTVSDPTLALLFSQGSDGIGLSQLRCSFGPLPQYNEDSDPENAVKAQALGAVVWAAPWSPPGAWKSNGTEENGGTLLSGHYSDWAQTFADFFALMQGTYGVNLIGMSVQNEPDWTAPYPSCIYSNAEIIAFMAVLGPVIATLSPRPLIIAPESANWGGLWSYADAILASPSAPYLDVIATHDYTYTTDPHAATTQEVWQTEVSTFDAPDASLSNGLFVAGLIQRALVEGRCSAWDYWEIDNPTDNEGLLISGALTKRLFALGNWSKFVRPGWSRVEVTGTVGRLSVTAFKAGSGAGACIVVINASGSPVATTLSFSAPVGSSVKPYVTTDTAIGAIGTDGNLSVGSVTKGVPTSIALTGGQYFAATVPVGITTYVVQP